MTIRSFVSQMESQRRATVRGWSTFARTMQFIWTHPIGAHSRVRCSSDYLWWQLSSRLASPPLVYEWISGAKLAVVRGMVGATGNIYVGLHEFVDMAFTLHALRSTDLFLDIGANIGSYTILAGAVVGARCISVEPHPSTYRRLLDNVELNNMGARVRTLNIALGSKDGMVKFSAESHATNRVIADQETDAAIEVPLRRVDGILAGDTPAVVKMDVEGFETEVLAGGAALLESPNLLALIVELNGSGRRYGFDEGLLREKLESSGFTPCTYSPFDRSLVPMSHAKGTDNQIFVRQSRLNEVQERVRNSPRLMIKGLSL